MQRKASAAAPADRLLGARPDPGEARRARTRCSSASSATSTACWCTAIRASRASSAASAPRRGIAGKLHYTGYVGRGRTPERGDAGTDEVLVSAGGGAVGRRLLETAIAARALSSLRDRTWRILAGDQCRRLRRAAGARRQRRDRRALPERFHAAPAKLRAVGQPGRVQHRAGDAAGEGARGGGALRGRRRIRADAAREAAGREGAAGGGGGGCADAGDARRGDRPRGGAAAAGAAAPSTSTARGAAPQLLREWLA